ncbi:MAG TPA: hypothetical protein VGM44_07020 [Polyangiaceae bacterium]
MNGAQSAVLLDQLIDALADRIVEKQRERDRLDHAGKVDQGTSPLGPRRHCAVVRKLVALGTPGAAIVGRRHLLSRELLERELSAVSKKRKPAPSPRVDDEDAEIDRMLASVGLERC